MRQKTKRNEDLVKDHDTGKYSIVDLVVKYGISHARIYQLIKREKSKLIVDNLQTE
jgi:Mor family transcriptional regulator